MDVFSFDGGADARYHFDLSGERLAPFNHHFENNTPPKSAVDIAATNVAIREYQKEYMDYWNSTVSQTGTGRPVEAFISPVAPYPASERDKGYYFAYTSFVNVLDYSSITIPVTKADQILDAPNANYTPLNEVDGRVQGCCKLLSNRATLSPTAANEPD